MEAVSYGSMYLMEAVSYGSINLTQVVADHYLIQLVKCIMVPILETKPVLYTVTDVSRRNVSAKDSVLMS